MIKFFSVCEKGGQQRNMFMFGEQKNKQTKKIDK